MAADHQEFAQLHITAVLGFLHYVARPLLY
jgi:hypothetical protein